MKTLLYAAAAMLAVSTAVIPAQSLAQDKVKASAGVDLWSLWRDGFDRYEKAEEAFRSGVNDNALKEYNASRDIFLSIRKQDPVWNKDVIAYRISLCERRIAAIAKKKAAEAKAVEEGSLKNEVKRLKNEIGRLMKDLETAKHSSTKADMLTEQIKGLLSEKDELAKRNAALLLKLESVQKSSKAASASDKQLLEEKTKNVKLGKEIASLKADIQILELQVKNYTSRINSAEANLKKAESKLQAASMKSATDESLKALNAGLEEKVTKLENDNRDYANRLAACDAEIRKLKESLKKGDAASADVQELEKSLTLAKKEYSVLKAENDKFKAERGEINKTVAKLSEDTKRLSVELAQNSAVCNSLQAEREGINKRMFDLTAKNAALSRENAALVKERDSLKSDIAKIAASSENIRKSAGNSEENAETLAVANAKLSQENEQLKKHITELKSSMPDSARKDVEDKVMLEREIGELKLKIADEQKKTAALSDELAALKTASAGAAAKVMEADAVAKKLAVSEAENKKLSEKLASAQSKTDALLVKLRGMSENPDSVRDEAVKRKDKAIDALVREGESLKKENDSFKRDLASANADINKLRDTLLRYNTERRAMREEIARLKTAAMTAPAATSAAVPVAVTPAANTPDVPEGRPFDVSVPKQTPADNSGDSAGTAPASTDFVPEETVEVDLKRYNTAMKAAKKAEKASDTAAALMSYWRAVDANPNAPDAHAGLARVYFVRGENASAAKAYEKAVKLGFARDNAFEEKLKAAYGQELAIKEAEKAEAEKTAGETAAQTPATPDGAQPATPAETK